MEYPNFLSIRERGKGIPYLGVSIHGPRGDRDQAIRETVVEVAADSCAVGLVRSSKHVD